MLIYLVKTSLILIDLDMLGGLLRGWLGNVNGMSQKSIFSIVENYATAIYLFVCLFRWNTQIKRHEQSLGEYMFWTIQADLGASIVVPCQYLDMIAGTDICHG